jgi:hypothetical protein
VKEIDVGFRVDIDGADAKRITRQLKGNPSTLFKEPFPGYLLFLFDLVSPDDVAFRNWFDKHVEPLHAMTGSEIAFAIFAHRVDVRVRHRRRSRFRHRRRSRSSQTGFDAVPYSRRNRVEVSVHSYRDFSSSIAGRCRSVADGGEISHTTEAVYELAKEFGVLQMLPCMIALDGLPDPAVPWKCFPISQCDLHTLYPRLRNAVGKFQVLPSLSKYRHRLGILKERADHRDQVEGLIERSSNLGREREEGWIADIRVALARGNEEKLLCSLRKLDEYHFRGRFTLNFMLRYFPTAQSLIAAIRELSSVLHMTWPASEDVREHLAQFYENNIRGLLKSATAMPSFQSRAEWVALHHELDRVRTAYLDQAMDELRSALTVDAECLTRADLEIYDAARSVLSMADRPSWVRILDEEFNQGSNRASKGIDESSYSFPADGTDRLLDWTDLPESLRHLTKLDLLGLLRLFRRLISQFGNAIWTRRPTAFASYASSDRSEVVRRVQGMRAFQPSLDVFLDFHSLYPGEVWRNRLVEEIERRDRFFLFWSEAASRSAYVAEEYKTAIRCGKPITPVPLSSPEEVSPPHELAHLHFNDSYVQFLRYAQLKADSRAQ